MESEETFLQVCVLKVQSLPAQGRSHAQSVLMSVWDLEADVNNGGFDQYFFNSAGDGAMAAIAALEEIGASQCAAILRDAIAALGMNEDHLGDRGLRQEALANLETRSSGLLGDCDKRFYAYPDDLAELLARYAREQMLGG